MELLGRGGNAEVWQARDAGDEVALKILNQRRAESEPYQRFRQEIDALRRIGPNVGVVPLIDSDLPQVPTRADPAWLAMPIALPLSEALAQAGLREVVSAVAEVAETLAGLREDMQIHHRDIKPSNLYLLDGHPAIGDFGLVDLPESAGLTTGGKPLGPLYFLPYEMVADPMHADPGPADVFSLAKTLWVLCVDQRWPPQGEQHASNDAYSIGRYRSHPLSHKLDLLIESCTRHDPASRPSMREVASDLRGWLDLEGATPAEEVDLSVSWSRLREVAAPKLREHRQETEQRDCFVAATRTLQESMQPLYEQIRTQFPAAEFNVRPKFVETLFHRSPKYDVSNENVRATILPGPGWNPVKLIIGTAVRTTIAGEVEIGGVYYLGRTETLGGYLDEWGPEYHTAPCGSLTLDARLVELAGELHARFPAWLHKFTAALNTNDS